MICCLYYLPVDFIGCPLIIMTTVENCGRFGGSVRWPGKIHSMSPTYKSASSLSEAEGIFEAKGRNLQLLAHTSHTD